MKTTFNSRLIPAAVSAGLIVIVSMMAVPQARADDAGAFIGGVLASKVVGNMRRRTEAEEQQAAAAQQQAAAAQRSTASSGGTQSIESRIQTLDDLLAKGYISKAEYDQRKKAILNSI